MALAQKQTWRPMNKVTSATENLTEMPKTGWTNISIFNK